MENSNGLTDAELIALFKSDNNSAALEILIEKYKPLIISRIAFYGFPKEEYDDLIQECLIGLYTAVLSYDSVKSSFGTFSKLCIDRMLISTLRKNNRLGTVPNSSITAFDEETVIPSDNSENPQNILEHFDDFERLNSKIKSLLSDMEYAVLVRVFRGEKYREIAATLNLSVKSVDNALQRIRSKFSNI